MDKRCPLTNASITRLEQPRVFAKERTTRDVSKRTKDSITTEHDTPCQKQTIAFPYSSKQLKGAPVGECYLVLGPETLGVTVCPSKAPSISAAILDARMVLNLLLGIPRRALVQHCHLFRPCAWGLFQQSSRKRIMHCEEPSRDSQGEGHTTAHEILVIVTVALLSFLL